MLAIAVFDIDGVVRDVGGSYRRALADTVEHYTQGAFRPSQADIDALKAEGIWNNDWEASQELVLRYFQAQGLPKPKIDYDQLVAWFQSRYRGPNPENWTGYICDEPLLMSAAYLESLSQGDVSWGFFSGATRGSATYVLQKRIGLIDPVLVAMEDAPGKPDPTGLFAAVEKLEQQDQNSPVCYIGDTVADMYTVLKARELQPERRWIAVGVLPPHVLDGSDRQAAYTETLKSAGAEIVLSNVEQLTPETILALAEK